MSDVAWKILAVGSGVLAAYSMRFWIPKSLLHRGIEAWLVVPVFGIGAAVVFLLRSLVDNG